MFRVMQNITYRLLLCIKEILVFAIYIYVYICIIIYFIFCNKCELKKKKKKKKKIKEIIKQKYTESDKERGTW